MLAYALKVASVAQAWLRTVVPVGAHALYLVVVGTAGGETVGHEHVEYVGIAEAHVLVAALLAWLELIGYLPLLPALLEVEGHGAGLCACEVHVY